MFEITSNNGNHPNIFRHARNLWLQANAVLYLSAPAADGTFTGSSPAVQEGSSVYCLTTTDGYNGSFSFIDSHDALATAMISVSQFVKSVCKVEGNTRQYPTRIVTIDQGSAVRECDVSG